MPVTNDNTYLDGDIKDKVGATAKPFALYYKGAKKMRCMFVDSTSGSTSEMKKVFKEKTKTDTIKVKDDGLYFGTMSFSQSSCSMVFESGTNVNALQVRGKKSKKALETLLTYQQGKISSITIADLDESSVDIPDEDEDEDKKEDEPEVVEISDTVGSTSVDVDSDPRDLDEIDVTAVDVNELKTLKGAFDTATAALAGVGKTAMSDAQTLIDSLNPDVDGDTETKVALETLVDMMNETKALLQENLSKISSAIQDAQKSPDDYAKISNIELALTLMESLIESDDVAEILRQTGSTRSEIFGAFDTAIASGKTLVLNAIGGL